MNKQQLIEKGLDVSHWPMVDKNDEATDLFFGDIDGVIYDTSKWPVPDDTYHTDNWPFWHSCDPNQPDPPKAAIEYFEQRSKSSTLGGNPRHEALCALRASRAGSQ